MHALVEMLATYMSAGVDYQAELAQLLDAGGTEVVVVLRDTARMRETDVGPGARLDPAPHCPRWPRSVPAGLQTKLEALEAARLRE